jgi:hypothetical protein
MTALMMTIWLTTAAAPGGWPMSADAPAEVRLAHSDFLKGDWTALAVHIREGLAARHNDPAATANLLELLDAAFEARGGAPLPVDFKVPGHFKRLKVAVKRRENALKGTVMFQIELFGEVKRGAFENVRIERYPNELVMDKQSGLGEWEVTAGEDGNDELWAAGQCGPTPPPEGLYLITMKTKGQAEVKGWFALNHHGSTGSPYFLAPGLGTTTGATPTFRWDDFHSPQCKKWETRAVNLLIFDPSWNVTWSQWFETAGATEATSAALKPGAYEAVLKFQERRRFGELIVGRDSAIALPFKVEGP